MSEVRLYTRHPFSPERENLQRVSILRCDLFQFSVLGFRVENRGLDLKIGLCLRVWGFGQRQISSFGSPISGFGSRVEVRGEGLGLKATARMRP